MQDLYKAMMTYHHWLFPLYGQFPKQQRHNRNKFSSFAIAYNTYINIQVYVTGQNEIEVKIF